MAVNILLKSSNRDSFELNLQAYFFYMKILLPFLLMSFVCLSQTPGGGVTDIEGNQYTTVIIGTHEWMAENLRTSSYSNGESIPNITDITQFLGLTTGAWIHNGNISQLDTVYGKLYNWFTISDARKICPSGWDVPTYNDWDSLIQTLDPSATLGNNIAGGKMKSTNPSYWHAPNTGATNESGFSARGGGLLSDMGYFYDNNYLGEWWSSTLNSDSIPYLLSLSYSTEYANLAGRYRNNALSIRCIKRPPLGIIELAPKKRELLRIIDLMGRETEPKSNIVLIYIYSDGSTEKVIKMD